MPAGFVTEQETPLGTNKPYTPRTKQKTHADIERRAYELYLERGKAPGHALDDWLQAEQEVFERNESEKFG